MNFVHLIRVSQAKDINLKRAPRVYPILIS